MSTISVTGASSGSLRFTRWQLTFDGTANKGANASLITLFTCTGEVLICYIVPFVVATLTQSGATPTLTLGVTGATTLFTGAATTATNLATGEFWTETTGGGTAEAGIAAPSTQKDIYISANVIGTVGGTNNINGGTLRVDCWWLPLSSDGNLA